MSIQKKIKKTSLIINIVLLVILAINLCLLLGAYIYRYNYTHSQQYKQAVKADREYERRSHEAKLALDQEIKIDNYVETLTTEYDDTTQMMYSARMQWIEGEKLCRAGKYNHINDVVYQKKLYFDWGQLINILNTFPDNFGVEGGKDLLHFVELIDPATHNFCSNVPNLTKMNIFQTQVNRAMRHRINDEQKLLDRLEKKFSKLMGSLDY